MSENVTATTVLKLLVRVAQSFLLNAWEVLGEPKKIVEVKKDKGKK